MKPARHPLGASPAAPAPPTNEKKARARCARRRAGFFPAFKSKRAHAVFEQTSLRLC
jgi:hypothetical protein